jgi:5-methylcytosine-specific restriction endonuclease McrA
MIKRPRPMVRLSKREILRRDDYTCQYCGQRSPILTLDHVIPRSRGGGHTWENLVTACPSCNHRKGRRTLEASGMQLLRPPMRPPSSALYLFGRYLSENGAWLPYVTGW